MKCLKKKILGICCVLFFFAAAMLVLTHTAQNGVSTTEVLPQINPDPVYVECEKGKELKVAIIPEMQMVFKRQWKCVKLPANNVA